MVRDDALSDTISPQTLNELPPIGSRRLRTLTIALKKARREEEGKGERETETSTGYDLSTFPRKSFRYDRRLMKFKSPLIVWILAPRRGEGRRGFEKSVSRNFYCGRLKTILKEDIKFSCFLSLSYIWVRVYALCTCITHIKGLSS